MEDNVMQLPQRGRGRVPVTVQAEIVRLRLEGRTAAEVAAALGVSRSAVTTYSKGVGLGRGRPGVDAERLAEITRLRGEGRTAAAVAAAVGVSLSTVTTYSKGLGLGVGRPGVDWDAERLRYVREADRNSHNSVYGAGAWEAIHGAP